LKRITSFVKLHISPSRNFRKKIKHITRFAPNKIASYKQALRHHSISSKIHENGTKDSNERLEYLGDAIINSVVAEYLFKKYPFENEGFLTELRSKIVSRSSLNDLALKIGLSKLVEYDRKALQNINLRNSIFGNALEAFVGAIFLDAGYKKAKYFIVENLLQIHLDVDKLKETETNFKGRLIEYSQKDGASLEFEVIEDSSNKIKHYKVTVLLNKEPKGQAEHASKKLAEQMASQKTMAMLNIE
jgi:ribonuclease-3